MEALSREKERSDDLWALCTAPEVSLYNLLPVKLKFGWIDRANVSLIP